MCSVDRRRQTVDGHMDYNLTAAAAGDEDCSVVCVWLIIRLTHSSLQQQLSQSVYSLTAA